MGNVCIDLNLINIWRSWYKYRQGKKKIKELYKFEYNLEDNLWRIYLELNNGSYSHGQYRHFVVKDNKRRDISVASICDKVIHRLIYDYLTEIFDKTFIYDVWSCRKDKGLTKAIERTEKMLKKYQHSFVWRADITKFFDNVRQDVLLVAIGRRVKDKKAFELIKVIINSYKYKIQYERERKTHRGIPIGNLTSQIFANIYLNELDRIIKHILKPRFYLRYGDDFIIIENKRETLQKSRIYVIKYLRDALGLKINPKNDIIIPTRKGLYFLGVEIYPTGRRLKRQIWQKFCKQISRANAASYRGLIKQNYHKKLPFFDWLLNTKL